MDLLGFAPTHHDVYNLTFWKLEFYNDGLPAGKTIISHSNEFVLILTNWQSGPKFLHVRQVCLLLFLADAEFQLFFS